MNIKFRQMLFSFLFLAAGNAAEIEGSPWQGLVSGGVEAVPNEFPWIVYIHTPNDYCAGIIIAPDWILTAGYCATNSLESYTVVAGEHNITEEEGREQRRPVSYIIIHPWRTQWFETQDVAVMQVHPPFEFNDWVQPATLAKPGFSLPLEAIAAGWGLQNCSVLSSETPVLLKATLPLMQGCIPPPFDRLCYGDKEFRTCDGDRGGPLMCGHNKTVCGIISHAPQQTNVLHHYDWIQSMTTFQEEDAEPSVRVKSCGGVVWASSGQISFMVDESLEPGTLCIWTVNTTRFQTRWVLRNSGLTEADELYITPFDIPSASPGHSTQISELNEDFFTSAGIFIVTFAVNSNEAKGFSLEFYSSGYGENYRRPHRFVAMNSSEGSFRHPEYGFYQWDERSLFVISPEKTRERWISFTYMSVWTSPNCSSDAVIIYEWENRSFKNLGRFCGFDNPNERPPPVHLSTGKALIAFWTDFYDVRYGFAIDWFSGE